MFPVGDLNNDGTEDVAISDPDDNNGTGDLYVVYGKPDTSAVNLSSLSAAGASSGGELGFHIPGDAIGQEFGSSAIGMTDATGDGNDDLLVGAPGASNGAVASGSTYLLSIAGTADPTVTPTRDTNPKAPACGGTGQQPCQPTSFSSVHGFGLAFQDPCSFELAPCQASGITAPISPTAGGPADTLVKARSMHIVRLLVKWDAADPANCKSTNTKLYAYGFEDPNADCSGISSFLQTVRQIEEQDNTGIAVLISITNAGTPTSSNYGAPAGSTAESTYKTAVGQLATYINDTLAIGDGLGIHAEYWGAWNEPDFKTGSPDVSVGISGSCDVFVGQFTRFGSGGHRPESLSIANAISA